MKIRKVKASDAKSLLNLMYLLDSETKFMMMEEGERTTTLENQIRIIESFSKQSFKEMFVALKNENVVGFIVGIGNTANRNKHSMYCVIGIGVCQQSCRLTHATFFSSWSVVDRSGFNQTSSDKFQFLVDLLPQRSGCRCLAFS